MPQTLIHCWPWVVLANAHPEEMHKVEISSRVCHRWRLIGSTRWWRDRREVVGGQELHSPTSTSHRYSEPQIQRSKQCHVPKTTIHMASKTGDFEKRIHISHNCIKVARSFPCQKMVDETHGRVFMPMFTIVILKYDFIAI